MTRFLVREHTLRYPDGTTVRIPARVISAENHLHFHHPGTSNHMRGMAVDAPGYYRTRATQRQLFQDWLRSADTKRLMREMPRSDVIALVRGAPAEAKLVAWAARKGDVQVGSIEDVRRERFLGARAAFRRINSSFRKRLPVQAALADMGREFDAIWPE